MVHVGWHTARVNGSALPLVARGQVGNRYNQPLTPIGAIMRLFEQYRPTQWSEVVGQDNALAKIDAVRKRGLGGRAYWISGTSGTGKTTIAGLLAAEVADLMMVDEIDAETLTPNRMQEWERNSHLCGWGKGGRVYIVNEAHGMKQAVIRQLLVTLERIPDHVAWIFTTTKAGQENLFGESEDSHPLLSRCTEIALTNQGLNKAFAVRAQQIAQAEGLNGQPIEKYNRLAKDCKNNMRAMLQKIEEGEMVE